MPKIIIQIIVIVIAPQIAATHFCMFLLRFFFNALLMIIISAVMSSI